MCEPKVEARNEDGATALVLAAYYGHAAAVEVLCDLGGADIQATAPGLGSPLQVAKGRMALPFVL